jgi:hypothetical protein
MHAVHLVPARNGEALRSADGRSAGFPDRADYPLTATVLAFPTPAPRDTGARERNRARIACHCDGSNRTLSLAEPITADLTMRHADPGDTAPCEYSAPAHDGA